MSQKASVLTYALLSQDAYHSSQDTKISPKLASEGWLRAQESGHNNDDFFARVYTHKHEKGWFIIAYRGTVLTDFQNLLTDLEIWEEKKPDTVRLAMDFYHQVASKQQASFPKDESFVVKVTGHSLGGALAQWVAVETALTAVVFNSPGIGDEKGLPKKTTYSNIHNVNSQDGVISKVGKIIGEVTELPVKAGEKDSEKPRWDLIARTKGAVEQHVIADVIKALKADPAVADEMF